MAAAGLKVATTTHDAVVAAALDEEKTSNRTKNTDNETGCLFANNEEHSFSLCNLPSLKELQSCSHNELQNKVPSENSTQIVRNLPEKETLVSSGDVCEFSQNYVEQGVVDNTLVTQLSPGLNLLQQTAAASSPPPHSYRHSRAYRHFKNPPQPHMCIRTTTDAGEELFINVLSWTRIVIPQEPSDPIPLYGGMRVPPGSPRSPPIVFAVMANPEVLKDSGRHSKDPEERRAMVELMCDFVEAMNPGIKLVRNAVILKDRDISGELKDVWNAVQAQRDREREEQMQLQRQQHFHNITNTSTNGNLITNSSLASINNCSNVTPPTQQMYSKSLSSGSVDNDILDSGTSPRSKKLIHEVQNDNNVSNKDVEMDLEVIETNNGHVSLASLAEHLDSKMSIVGDENEKSEECRKKQPNIQNTLTNDALNNENNSEISLERQRTVKTDCGNQLNATNSNKDLKKQQPMLANGSVANVDVSSTPKTNVATSTPNAATTIPAPSQPTNIAPPAVAQQPPPKKEKLGGFLPNGCIFPRFNKNNKHKDKDKEKEKETKTKDKEKNILLSALKKSKDKKTNAITAAAAAATACNIDEKNTSSNSNTTATHCNQTNTKQQKNCLQQLDCGIQKLDLTNNHHNHNLIVENNANNGAAITNKNTTTTASNAGGVSVH